MKGGGAGTGCSVTNHEGDVGFCRLVLAVLSVVLDLGFMASSGMFSCVQKDQF